MSLFSRRPDRPPVVSNDPFVASLKPYALRMILDRIQGNVADLQSRVAAIENVQREMWERFDEVQYRKDSSFARKAKVAEKMAKHPPPDPYVKD